MKINNKSCSIAVASTAIVLFFILISSTALSSSTVPCAYITRGNTVSVIDIATDTVIATVNVGNGLHGIAVNSVGTKVYVTNRDSNTVSVIDTSTNMVTATCL